MTTASRARFASPNELRVAYHPRGSAVALLDARDAEVVLDGPAGTGKTYAALWKLHIDLLRHAGARGLMLRKTHVSLKSTALVTFREKVLPGFEGVVRYYGGSAIEPSQFRYANGSRLVVGGLDSPGKIMSSEYDIAYVNEATDLTLNDWESITTRLRYGRMPYQQLMGDCNPSAPTHWLNTRMQAGLTRRIISRHEDNPTVKPEYLARLDALTGVRYLRLRLGVWAAAEGMVYQDAWDRARNVVPRRTICRREGLYGDCGIERSWPRYLVVDFGLNNPFVAQWWVLTPDDQLVLYRELYHTQRIVEDHAKAMREAAGWELRSGRAYPSGPKSDPLPYAVICDHDLEDRFTLTRHLGLSTQAAYKDVSAGIQAVAARMRPGLDGKPRLLLLEDSLLERDPDLADRKLPTCTVEEVEGYVWKQGQNGRAKDDVVKENDHGLDAMRYLVAARDLRDSDVSYIPNVF